jgi:hypothetical protein
MSLTRRKDALDMMPNTLNDFYHRMLDDIPEESAEIVRKALNWLVFSARRLTLAELAEAVIIMSTPPCFDPGERLDNEECLLEVLPSGFIKYVGRQYPLASESWSKDEIEVQEGQSLETTMSLTRRRRPTIQLAHHSVKEYLLSAHLSNPLFKLELLSASQLLGKTCLDYALHVV